MTTSEKLNQIDSEYKIKMAKIEAIDKNIQNQIKAGNKEAILQGIEDLAVMWND